MSKTFCHEGYYVCKCGREFTKSQSYNAHKSWCKIHLGEKLYNNKCKKESKSHLGKLNVNYGKPRSDSDKLKISKGHIGVSPSEETREKISNSMSGSKHYFYGNHHTDETKRKISESIILGYKNGREVKGGNVYSKRSYYKSNLLKSSYEAIYLVWLLWKRINYKYEAIRLQYVDTNNIYVTDFYLPDYNKIVEVKGYHSEKNDYDLMNDEELVLVNGYNWESIVGWEELHYYWDELLENGINIDELDEVLQNSDSSCIPHWDFVDNKIIILRKDNKYV